MSEGYRFIPPEHGSNELSAAEIAAHQAAVQLVSSDPNSDTTKLQSLAISAGFEIAPTDLQQLRAAVSRIWRSSPDKGLLFIIPIVSESAPSEPSSVVSTCDATSSSSSVAPSMTNPSDLNPTNDPLIEYMLSQGIIPQQKPANGTLLKPATRSSPSS